MSRTVRVGIIVSRFGEDYREEKRREENRTEFEERRLLRQRIWPGATEPTK
jgi:hypothetical protein